MREALDVENECFSPGCEDRAELWVATITDFRGGISIELCAKHSETIAPELMRIYYCVRLRDAEERDKARREANDEGDGAT